MRGDNFIFLAADGTVKLSEGDQVLRASTFIRDRPDRGEEQGNPQGESDELSSPTPLQDDSTRDGAEAKNDFGTFTGQFIYHHHVEPKVSNCTCREKNHFLFQWNVSTLPEQQIHPWMYCWRKYRRLLERWWRSRIVRYMDRFLKIHYIEWKSTGWMYMVPEESGKKTNDVQARDLEIYVWCIQTQRKAQVCYRET